MTDRPPPAKGLKLLTWPEVEQLDQHIADICAAGNGEVLVTVRNGKPVRVSPRPSYGLSPYYHEDFSIEEKLAET